MMEFCANHKTTLMFSMIMSSVKTYLKAYICDKNQQYAEEQEMKQKRSREKAAEREKRMKDRKLEIMTGNKN